MNKFAFYRGLLFELNKTANDIPQPKKPWYSTPLGMGAVGLASGLGGYGAYKMFGSGMPSSKTPFSPTDTNFEESATPNAFSKTTDAMNSSMKPMMYSAAGANVAKPITSRLAELAQDRFGTKLLNSTINKVAPLATRGMIGANGVSMISDALDPNNQVGAGYKALQAGGGSLDAGLQLMGNNTLKRGLTSLAENPLMQRTMTGSRLIAPEYLGAKALKSLRGGPMVAATLGGTVGQMALDYGTGKAEDAVNSTGAQGADLVNLLEQSKNPDQTQQAEALRTMSGLFGSQQGSDYLNDATNPGGWANYGSNTSFFKGPSGQSMEEPVTKNLVNRLFNTYKDKQKELGTVFHPHQDIPRPEQVPGIYDSSPVY